MDRLADALVQFDPGNPADPLSPLNPNSPLSPLNPANQAPKQKRETREQQEAAASTETASDDLPIVEEHSGAWLVIGAVGIVLLLATVIAVIRRLT